METEDILDLDMDSFNTTYILQEDDGPNDVYLVSYVIFGILTPLGILTSLALTLCPLFIRKLRTPFFIVLASWCLANILYLIVRTVSVFTSQESWTLGEFSCHVSMYLESALQNTRPYLLVLAGLVTVLGNRRCQRWTESRQWLRIVAPCLASMVVWLLAFLPSIWYWFHVKYISYFAIETRHVCHFAPENRIAFVLTEFFLRYLLPSTLISVLLLTWACLRHKSKTSDSVESVQACLLFILLHLYLATQLLLFATLLFDAGGYVFYLFAWYLSLADFAVSPAVCLFVIFLCRRSLKQTEANSRNDGSEERDGDTKMELVQ